jgi:hypothetical protein
VGYMVSELIMAINILAQWAITTAFLGTIKFRDTILCIYNVTTRDVLYSK